MASNLRLSKNIWNNAQTIITATSTYPGSAAENVLVAPTELKWTSLSAFDQILDGDLGDLKPINFIAILGIEVPSVLTAITVWISEDPDIANNFLYREVKLSNDIYGDPEVFPLVMMFWVGETINARYYRVKIDAQQATSENVDVGRVIVGDYFEPTINMDLGYRLGLRDSAPRQTTPASVIRSLARPKNRVTNLRLSALSRDEEVILNKMNAGQEVWISGYPEYTDDREVEQQHTFAGLLRKDVNVSRTTEIDRSTQIEIVDSGAVAQYASDPMSTIWLKASQNLADLDDASTARINIQIGDDFPAPNLLENSEMYCWKSEDTGDITTQGITAAERWFIFNNSATYRARKGAIYLSTVPNIGYVQPLTISMPSNHSGFAVQQYCTDLVLTAISGTTVTASFEFSALVDTVLDNIRIILRPTSAGEVSVSLPGPFAYTASSGKVRYTGTVSLPDIGSARDSNPYAVLVIGSTIGYPDRWQDCAFGAAKFECSPAATRWVPSKEEQITDSCKKHYQYGLSNETGAFFWQGSTINGSAYGGSIRFPIAMHRDPTWVFTPGTGNGFNMGVQPNQLDGGVWGTNIQRFANATQNSAFYYDFWEASTGF